MASQAEKLNFAIKNIDNNTIVIHLKGDLDMYTLPVAKEKMKEVLADKIKRVIIDLENVNYIDSSGLGFFIGTLKKMREFEGELKLIKLTPYIYGIFKLIQLHQIISIHESEDEALNAFDEPAKI
ncbi:anti-sigma factor antagonist [Candidatus Riflebacteria bacterium]